MPSRDKEIQQIGKAVPGDMYRRRGSQTLPPALDDPTGFEMHLVEFRLQLTAEERSVFESILGTRNAALTTLGAVAPEVMLEPEEQEVVRALLTTPQATQRTLPAQVLLIMKATLLCNLRCTYCSSWSDQPNRVMSFNVLAHAIHGALTAPGVKAVSFIWHGGETTLRPLSFYRKALWLQERFRRPGQTVRNAIQTNGTHLTGEWLEFLMRYGVSVGISLDGPPEVHDRRRLDIKGRPTSERVQAGLRALRENGISHGVLMVVDEDVVEFGAERTLNYLLNLGVRNVSLLNVAPEGDPAESTLDEPYLDYGRFVEYLRDLFRIWYPRYAQQISFREISDLVGKFQGRGGSFCVYGPNCIGRFFTVEPTGDVSHCDKYQGNPDYRFGNVLITPLNEIPTAPKLLHASGYTAAGLDLCHSCPWFDLCHGGCPYDRYVRVVRRRRAQDERCCGLAPLLADIAEVIDPMRQHLRTIT